MQNETRKLILLVEDEMITAMTIEKNLNTFGYGVLTANSGENALKMIQILPEINLILMDIDLGTGIDGTEAAKQILKIRNLPIVFLTSHAEKEYVEKVKEISRYGYVIKNSGDFVLQSSLEMAFALFEANQSTLNELQERRKIEQELRSSEEKYRLFIENSSDVVFCVNEKGEYQFTNKVFANAFGKTPDYFVGKTFWDIYPQAEADHRQAASKRVFETGETQSVEVSVPLPDRTLYFLAKANPIFNQEGKVILNLTFATDITERKVAEEKLRLRESYLTAIIENQPGLVWLKDLEGRFLAVNKSFALSCGKTLQEEVVGKTDFDFWPVDLAEKYRKDDAEVIRSKAAIHVEEDIPKKGHSKSFETFKMPILNEEGQVIGTTGFAHDITARKIAEADLINSEEQLSFVLDATNDGIYDWNIGRNYVYFSPRYYQMLGYEPNEFEPSYESWKNLLHPDDLSDSEQALFKAIENKYAYNVEFRLKTKSGDWKWINGRGKVMEYDENDKPLRIIGTHVDINERKKAEKQIQEIIDYNPMSIQLVDLEGYTLMINSAHTKLFGAVPPLDYTLFHDKQLDDQGFRELMDRAMTGKITYFPDFIYNAHQVNPDFPDQPVWIRMVIFPIFGDDGKPERYVVMHEDISEQKAAKEKLFAEKERLAVTLRSIGDGVITTDTKGNVVLLNKVAEMLTGWTSSEATGKPLSTVFNIINETSRLTCENPADKVLQTGLIVELANHTLLVSKDGSERIIADSAAPIKNANSETIGVVLVFRDMTEKQKLIEASQNNQKLESVGMLAGGIAHDFNNLLGGIYSYIDLAVVESKETPISNYLSHAMNTIDRARGLTQQLLTFSKGGEPIMSKGNLFPAIQDNVKFALSGSNVSTTFEIQDGLWQCEFDKNQIGQVIDNLIRNAQQAMPLGGNVLVSAKNIILNAGSNSILPEGNYVELTIKDKGMGIPKEMLPRIFDPFFTTKSQGHGLGLTICYSIVNRHKGTINVESELGRGTTFQVLLPAIAEPVCMKTSLKQGIHAGSGIIVVMDDEELIRGTMDKMLHVLGYSSLLAKDGQEALDLIMNAKQTDQQLKAVILDLTIPDGLGGKDIIGKIRAIDSKLPVFVSSGYSIDPIMANPESYGFTASIPKPFGFSDLSEVFNRYLNNK